jgi:hypothetical protein
VDDERAVGRVDGIADHLALDASDLAPRAAYVLDVATNTWATYSSTTMGVRRYDMAGVGYRDAAVDHVGLYVGGASAVPISGAAPAVSTANGVVLTNGRPFFFGASSLPAARSGASVALGPAGFAVYGGGQSATVASAGRHSLFSLPPAAVIGGGTWTTRTDEASSGRQGHILVLSAFDEPVLSDLVRYLAVGGTDASTLASRPLEYLP